MQNKEKLKLLIALLGDKTEAVFKLLPEGVSIESLSEITGEIPDDPKKLNSLLKETLDSITTIQSNLHPSTGDFTPPVLDETEEAPPELSDQDSDSQKIKDFHKKVSNEPIQMISFLYQSLEDNEKDAFLAKCPSGLRKKIKENDVAEMPISKKIFSIVKAAFSF